MPLALSLLGKWRSGLERKAAIKLKNLTAEGSVEAIMNGKPGELAS